MKNYPKVRTYRKNGRMLRELLPAVTTKTRVAGPDEIAIDCAEFDLLRKQHTEMTEMLRRAKDRCIRGETLWYAIEDLLRQIDGKGNRSYTRPPIIRSERKVK